MAAGGLGTELPSEKGVHPGDCLLVGVPRPSEMWVLTWSIVHERSLLWVESRISEDCRAGVVTAVSTKYTSSVRWQSGISPQTCQLSSLLLIHIHTYIDYV